MRFTNLALALAVTGAAAVTTAHAARDTIQIAGSSTVLPYASIVAEEFGNTFPQFKTPVVGSGGSSGGLKQFCNGVGTTPSISQTLLVKSKVLNWQNVKRMALIRY